MLRSLLAIVALLALTPSAHALDVEVRELFESGGFARAEVAVTNDDLRAGYRQVTIRCVWSHRGQAVAQGSATARGLDYRETAVIEPAAELRGAVFESVACNVNWAVEN